MFVVYMGTLLNFGGIVNPIGSYYFKQNEERAENIIIQHILVVCT